MKNSKHVFKFLLPLLLILFSCEKQELELLESAEVQSPEFRNSSSTQHDIKVVSQNVGWLTDPIAGFDDHWQDMADWLWQNRSDADVIVIQEAFSGEIDQFKSYFNNISNNAYKWTNINKAKNGIFNKGHGIVIMSKFLIQSEYHHDYNVCSGDLFSCGTDCLADKGFVRATLNLGFGKRAYIIGTHLDSDDCYNDKVSRYEQLQQIDNYISYSGSLNHSYPLLIVGDMNINCRSVNNPDPNSEAIDLTIGAHSFFVPDYGSNYKYMKAELKAWASWAGNKFTDATDYRATTPDGKLLDYIFVRNDFAQPINWSSYDYHVHYTPSDVIHKYTDHANVSHEFTFNIADSPPDPNADCNNNGDCLPGELCIGGDCIPM